MASIVNFGGEQLIVRRRGANRRAHATYSKPGPYFNKRRLVLDWEEVAIGRDCKSVWHLFHLHRAKADNDSTYWIHHDNAILKITRGRMYQLAIELTRGVALSMLSGDGPILSRFRKVIERAIEKELQEIPEGKPIKTVCGSIIPIMRFGTAVYGSNRHWRFYDSNSIALNLHQSCIKDVEAIDDLATKSLEVPAQKLF